MSMTASAFNAHGAQDHPTGWRRYVYATNHKDIGTMYLVFAISAGILGVAFSILIQSGTARARPSDLFKSA